MGPEERPVIGAPSSRRNESDLPSRVAQTKRPAAGERAHSRRGPGKEEPKRATTEDESEPKPGPASGPSRPETEPLFRSGQRRVKASRSFTASRGEKQP
jgi:hypothetical protein